MHNYILTGNRLISYWSTPTWNVKPSRTVTDYRTDQEHLVTGKVQTQVNRIIGGKILVKMCLENLKYLSETFLYLTIQADEHESILDAQAAMQHYLLVKEDWEQEFKQRNKF
jgi:hypothetical protein